MAGSQKRVEQVQAGNILFCQTPLDQVAGQKNAAMPLNLGLAAFFWVAFRLNLVAVLKCCYRPIRIRFSGFTALHRRQGC